ncbi:DUF4388 domain-containing protein [Calditrichota bacterium]
MADEPITILIVDDEKDITDAISEYLRQNHNMDPLVANDPKMVVPLLEEHSEIKLILCDFRMPEISGLDLLLDVKEKFGSIYFLIMTGYGTPELKNEVLRRGAIRYIEKPFNMPELVETIQDVIGSSGSGFGGRMEKIRLADIIQLVALSQRTVALNVLVKDRRGVLYFENGEVMHALCGDLVGEDAFYELFNWSGGQFSLGAHSAGGDQTISMSWQGLLMEATRRQDEKMESGEDSETSETQDLDEDELIAQKESELFREMGMSTQSQPEEKSDDIEFTFDSLEPGKPIESLESTEPAEIAEIEQEEELSEEELQEIMKEIEPESAVDVETPTGKSEVEESFESIELQVEDEIEDVSEDEFAVVEEETKPTQVSKPEPEIKHQETIGKSVISDELFSEMLDSAVGFFMGRWPEGAKTLHYGLLIHLENNIHFVRQHLQFQFEFLVSQVINSDIEAFNFADENIADAVDDLKQTLADRWLVSQKEYRKILFNSVGFELMRCIQPATALAQLLFEQSAGETDKVKKLIGLLQKCEILDDFYTGLSEQFVEKDDQNLSTSDLEEIINQTLTSHGEAKKYSFARQSIERIMQISGLGKRKGASSLNINVVTDLFKSSGLGEFSKFIRSTEPRGEITVSLDDIDTAMKRFAN